MMWSQTLEEMSQISSWVVVSNIFHFHPSLGKIPILTIIFFKGVGSTTNCKMFVGHLLTIFCILRLACLKGTAFGGSARPLVV